MRGMSGTLGRGRFSKIADVCVCVCVCGCLEGGRVSKSVRTRRDARLFPSSTRCSSILRPDGPGTGRESELGLRFAVSVELVLGSRIVGLGESLEEVETGRLARKAFSAEAWRACYGVDSPINYPYQTLVPRAFPARIPQWVLAFVTVQTRLYRAIVVPRQCYEAMFSLNSTDTVFALQWDFSHHCGCG